MSLPGPLAAVVMPVEDMRLTYPRQRFKGHSDRVTSVIQSPDTQRIMTCSRDGSLGVWDLQTGQQIASWDDGKSPMRAISLSVDGKRVVSGSDDGVVRLWNIETGKVIAKWTGHTSAVASVCWNRGGGLVLSGSWDGTAKVWDVDIGTTVLQLDIGLNNVYTTIFSPDSALIATGGSTLQGEPIKIWNADTGILVAILKGHTSYVSCLAWTGRMLISGSHDYTIRTWNTSTWQPLAVLRGHTHPIRGIAISPDDSILASASWDKTARLWNLENGQPIASPFQHPRDVDCVSFSADGTLLITGCDDENVHTWDISGSNELLDSERSSQDDKKSFLDADATPHPVQESENAHRLPEGFFDESPQHSDPIITRPMSPSSVPHDSDPLPDVEPSSSERRFFQWFRRNTHERLTFLQWTHVPLFRRRQRHADEGTELQEPRPPIVDVPLAQGLSRYATEGGVRRMKEKQKDEDEDEEVEVEQEATQVKTVNHAKSIATTSQSDTQSNITHQSAGPSQVNLSSEPQPAVSTPPADATPHPSTTSSTPHPEVILHAGWWTSFFVCMGCASVRHQNGHH